MSSQARPIPEDFFYLSDIDVSGNDLYAVGAIQGTTPLYADANIAGEVARPSAVVLKLDGATGIVNWIRVRESMSSSFYQSVTADGEDIYAAGVECVGSLSKIFLERVSREGEVYATRAFTISCEVWILQIKVGRNQLFLLAPAHKECEVVYLNALSLQLDWEWYLPLKGISRAVYGQTIACYCDQVYLGWGAMSTLTIGDYVLNRPSSISPETIGVVVLLKSLFPKNLGFVVATESGDSCSPEIAVRFFS
jgi:hypothetical protein